MACYLIVNSSSDDKNIFIFVYTSQRLMVRTKYCYSAAIFPCLYLNLLLYINNTPCNSLFKLAGRSIEKTIKLSLDFNIPVHFIVIDNHIRSNILNLSTYLKTTRKNVTISFVRWEKQCLDHIDCEIAW